MMAKAFTLDQIEGEYTNSPRFEEVHKTMAHLGKEFGGVLATFGGGDNFIHAVILSLYDHTNSLPEFAAILKPFCDDETFQRLENADFAMHFVWDAERMGSVIANIRAWVAASWCLAYPNAEIPCEVCMDETGLNGLARDVVLCLLGITDIEYYYLLPKIAGEWKEVACVDGLPNLREDLKKRYYVALLSENDSAYYRPLVCKNIYKN